MYLRIYPHRHFVPNISIGAPVVKCLRKKIPDAFFGTAINIAFSTFKKFISIHRSTHDGIRTRKGVTF